jgi:hypothetical protein
MIALCLVVLVLIGIKLYFLLVGAQRVATGSDSDPPPIMAGFISSCGVIIEPAPSCVFDIGQQ